jgi:hypothetical protein
MGTIGWWTTISKSHRNGLGVRRRERQVKLAILIAGTFRQLERYRSQERTT